MRDLEHWKDKVELSLDGRQIFFIFFGSSVLACMIFVFGVMLGKRLEARALALSPPAAEDPLAALDQLSDADDGLTFHHALTSPRKNAPAAASPSNDKKPEAKPVAVDADAKSGGDVVPAHLPTLPAQAAPKPEPGHFTLQLSAFPDKSDADEFMRRVQAAGYHPFIVESEVPGRGTFYRVRVGDFASREAAANFKADFEKKQHLMAYVAKI